MNMVTSIEKEQSKFDQNYQNGNKAV